MFFKSARKQERRGVSTVEWAGILAIIGAGTIASITLVGRNTESELDNTAEGVKNPPSLRSQIADGKKDSGTKGGGKK